MWNPFLFVFVLLVGLSLYSCQGSEVRAYDKPDPDYDEPQCNGCKCFGGKAQPASKYPGTINKKTYDLIGNKLKFYMMCQGLGIKCDLTNYQTGPITETSYLVSNGNVERTIRTDGQGHSAILDCTLVGNIQYCKYAKSRTSEEESSQINNGTQDRAWDQNVGEGRWKAKAVWGTRNQVLFVSCFGSKQYGGWYLASTSRKLGRWTKKQTLRVIKRLGFNPEQVIRLKTK